MSPRFFLGDKTAERSTATVGTGDRVPWADKSLTCPKCGTGPLELRQSDPPGLTFIMHCGESWLRDQPAFDRIFR